MREKREQPKQPTMSDLAAFMRRAGEACGVKYAAKQATERRLRTKVPLAAHLYALHFSRLRSLSLEVSRAGKSLSETQGTAHRAAEAESQASTMAMLAVRYEPHKREVADWPTISKAKEACLSG